MYVYRFPMASVLFLWHVLLVTVLGIGLVAAHHLLWAATEWLLAEVLLEGLLARKHSRLSWTSRRSSSR